MTVDYDGYSKKGIGQRDESMAMHPHSDKAGSEIRVKRITEETTDSGNTPPAAFWEPLDAQQRNLAKAKGSDGTENEVAAREWRCPRGSGPGRNFTRKRLFENSHDIPVQFRGKRKA